MSYMFRPEGLGDWQKGLLTRNDGPGTMVYGGRPATLKAVRSLTIYLKDRRERAFKELEEEERGEATFA